MYLDDETPDDFESIGFGVRFNIFKFIRSMIKYDVSVARKKIDCRVRDLVAAVRGKGE